jgi:two-component system cell cycle sensor histidine kinase/response regulator CckA
MQTDHEELERLRIEHARLRASEAELRVRAASAEQNLQANQALLAAALENLPFDFWARDKDDRCIVQNATARANWGDQLNKRTREAQVPPQVLETWIANNQRALDGETVRGDFEYTKDGETRYVSNLLSPIRVDGAIVGTLGVNVDVTELKRTVLALRDSQEKLRLAVDIAGVGLWSWDPAQNEVVWEPTLSAIFGLPAGTAPAGREGYLALVHPDDREAAARASASGVQSGHWEHEYRIVRTDGAVRWLVAKGTLVDVAGRRRVVGSVIDVTEARQREEQLRQAQKLEAVGQLTAGIAHNFNNMLMGVLPNLELAVQRAPAELVPLLQSATDSARRAADLVRKLTTYAGGNRPGERKNEEIGLLVTRAVELCRTTFDRRIALEYTNEAGARARVDATQIEQALLNLLINARDAVESPQIQAPCLSVSVGVVRSGADELGGRAGDYVCVRVRDNGVGMDEATVHRIYEPFFTTKDVGKGTGLGLATTHAIVREHGGFLACESVKGRGTTFSLYLPLEPGAPARARVASERPLSMGTETVLVVDDEPAVRGGVMRVLASGGYTARGAASGSEALELLADPDFASTVALVLLDVSMPGLPRRELRSRLRELMSAPVIYFTGYALDAADADADDAVLEKPVTRERLLRTVREALDRG